MEQESRLRWLRSQHTAHMSQTHTSEIYSCVNPLHMVMNSKQCSVSKELAALNSREVHISTSSDASTTPKQEKKNFFS